MITDHSDSLDNIQHIFALFTRYSFHSFTLCRGVVDISHPSLFLLLSFPSSSFDEALVFLSFSLFSLTRWTRRSKKKWDKRANVKKRCARTEEARGESRAGQGRGSGIDRGSSKPMFSFVSIPSFIHIFIPSTFFSGEANSNTIDSISITSITKAQSEGIAQGPYGTMRKNKRKGKKKEKR